MGIPGSADGGHQGVVLFSGRRREILFERVLSFYGTAATAAFRLDAFQYRRCPVFYGRRHSFIPVDPADPAAGPAAGAEGLVAGHVAPAGVPVLMGLRAVQWPMGSELQPAGHSRTIAA